MAEVTRGRGSDQGERAGDRPAPEAKGMEGGRSRGPEAITLKAVKVTQRMVVLRERIAEVLAAMPKDQPPRGRRPNWGDQREVAYYLANLAGHNFNRDCQSCDADVYDALLSLVK